MSSNLVTHSMVITVMNQGRFSGDDKLGVVNLPVVSVIQAPGRRTYTLMDKRNQPTGSIDIDATFIASETFTNTNAVDAIALASA